MIRFALLPMILMFASIFFGLFIYLVYRKVKTVSTKIYKKSVEIASDTHQQWKDKEQRKQFPDPLQKGFEHYDEIKSTTKILPQAWQQRINPLNRKCKQLLDEIAFRTVEIDTKSPTDDSSNNRFNTETLTSMRTFFAHTLDAQLQLVKKLQTDVTKMDDSEQQKVIENIALLDADLNHHQTILDKKRKFDFDVLMDVIKARLKN